MKQTELKRPSVPALSAKSAIRWLQSTHRPHEEMRLKDIRRRKAERPIATVQRVITGVREHDGIRYAMPSGNLVLTLRIS